MLEMARKTARKGCKNKVWTSLKPARLSHLQGYSYSVTEGISSMTSYDYFDTYMCINSKSTHYFTTKG